jgi:hypothetical protein
VLLHSLANASGRAIRSLLGIRPGDFVIDGYECANCGDVHSEQTGCPKAILTGFCLDCDRRRVLDRYFCCLKYGHRTVCAIRVWNRKALVRLRAKRESRQ